MIFFFNAQGNLVESKPENVRQGSNKASRIWFVMPTASTNVVSIAFTLPNGEYAKKRLMTKSSNDLPYKDELGNNINVWYYDLLTDITSYAGKTELSFFVSGSDDELISTPSSEIIVTKGTPSTNLPALINEYEEIVQVLAGVNSTVQTTQEKVQEVEEISSKLLLDFEKLETDTKELVQTTQEKVQEVEEALGKQIANNTNKIASLFNLHGIFAYDNAELTEELQQTGGDDLVGLTILDGSYATVNKISGNTVASKNLIPYPYRNDEGLISFPYTTGGLTFTENDGAITVSGTSSDDIIFVISPLISVKSGDVISISGLTDSYNDSQRFMQVVFIYNDGSFRPEATISSSNGIKVTIPIDVPYVYIRYIIYSGIPINETIYPMLNYGEISEYAPYFAGLKNAKISGIKSIGKNLYDNYAVSATNANLTSRTNPYGTTISSNDASKEVVVTQVANSSYGAQAYQNGYLFYFYTTPIEKQYNTIIFSFDLEITNNPLNTTYMSLLSAYYNNTQVSINRTLLNKTQRVKATLTKKSTPSPSQIASYVEVRCGGMSFKISNVQICSVDATNPSEFEPYTESTMQLPQTVELGKWDYIENGQIVRQTGEQEYTITGENNWMYSEQYKQYYVNIHNTFGIKALGYVATSEFKISISGGDSTNGYILFVINKASNPNLPFSTLDECKAYFNDNPITFKYKTVTPTYEPITFDNQYLVWDKGIEQVLTPKDDNGKTCFDYGANTTEENSYYVIVGGND